MELRTIALRVLNRMDVGVPEVQKRPFAGFALVRADDLRFDPAAFVNRMLKCSRIGRVNSRNVFSEPAKEGRIANCAVLDHFGETRLQLSLGLPPQAMDVDEH